MELDMTKVTKPCVYYLLDANRIPLYIGCSTVGLLRVFSTGSSYEPLRKRAFDEATFASIVFFEDIDKAREWERKEIWTFRPEYNLGGRFERDGTCGKRELGSILSVPQERE